MSKSRPLQLITETRTLRNVFNPSDFDTQTKSWDKRMRTNFIQRLIDFAANHKEPVVGCVAAKLVAGLEPAKSNELLQALAKIAQARVTGGQLGKGPRTFTLQPATTSRSRQQPVVGQGQGESASTAPVNSSAATSRRSSGDRPRLGSGSGSGSRQSSSVTRRNSSKENVKALTGTAGPPSRRTSNLATNVGSADSRRQSESSPTATSQNLRSRQQLASNIRDRQSSRQPNDQIDGLSTTKTTTTTKMVMATNEPSLKVGSRRESLAGSGVPFVPISSRQVLDVTSEGDMSKSIQVLRVNMRQFRALLSDIGQLEAGLKSKLVKYQ